MSPRALSLLIEMDMVLLLEGKYGLACPYTPEIPPEPSVWGVEYGWPLSVCVTFDEQGFSSHTTFALSGVDFHLGRTGMELTTVVSSPGFLGPDL